MLESIILSALLLFLLGFSFVLISAFLGFVLTRVPFVRSPKKDLMEVFARFPLKDGQVFYDLGSGDGKIIFVAEETAKIQGVGFEQTLWTNLLARFRARLRKSKAIFFTKDFFKVSWQEADVLYAYLYPPLMAKIEKKFLAECRPGTMFIVRDFPFPGIKPSEVMLFERGHEVYIYFR